MKTPRKKYIEFSLMDGSRDAKAKILFYFPFAKAMKKRSKLNAQRLRMIETKKATPKRLEDSIFMLMNNQNDIDEILAGIGNFYLTRIL